MSGNCVACSKRLPHDRIGHERLCCDNHLVDSLGNPPGLEVREGVWESLLTLAEIAGGVWPDKASVWNPAEHDVDRGTGSEGISAEAFGGL
jgi:hypothetical protein